MNSNVSLTKKFWISTLAFILTYGIFEAGCRIYASFVGSTHADIHNMSKIPSAYTFSYFLVCIILSKPPKFSAIITVALLGLFFPAFGLGLTVLANDLNLKDLESGSYSLPASMFLMSWAMGSLLFLALNILRKFGYNP